MLTQMTDHRNEKNTEAQERSLREYVVRRGWKIHRIYRDIGVSGASKSPPARNELLRDCRSGMSGDVVLVYKFDRFARSLNALISGLEMCRSTPLAGTRHPQESCKISECDAFLPFLFPSLTANHCTTCSYISLSNGERRNHQPTNPHRAPQNALKLAKTQLRVQRQGLPAAIFHPQNSDPNIRYYDRSPLASRRQLLLSDVWTARLNLSNHSCSRKQ